MEWWFKGVDIQRVVEVEMVAHICNPEVGKQRQEHQEFKVTFSHTVNLKPSWAPWDKSQKQNKAKNRVCSEYLLPLNEIQFPASVPGDPQGPVTPVPIGSQLSDLWWHHHFKVPMNSSRDTHIHIKTKRSKNTWGEQKRDEVLSGVVINHSLFP